MSTGGFSFSFLLILSITKAELQFTTYIVIRALDKICHAPMKMPRGTLRSGYCHAKLKDTIMYIKVKAVL